MPTVLYLNNHNEQVIDISYSVYYVRHSFSSASQSLRGLFRLGGVLTEREEVHN